MMSTPTPEILSLFRSNSVVKNLGFDGKRAKTLNYYWMNIIIVECNNRQKRYTHLHVPWGYLQKPALNLSLRS